MLDSFLNVVNQVWNDGLYGIGITELIVSIVILFGGFIVRGVFIARVFKWLEKLSDQTESEADDALLETLKKPLGYLPITIAFLPLKFGSIFFISKKHPNGVQGTELSYPDDKFPTL